jgi:hypothetical protein
MSLHARVLSTDGAEQVDVSLTRPAGSELEAIEVGHEAAALLLEQGADGLLVPGVRH